MRVRSSAPCRPDANKGNPKAAPTTHLHPRRRYATTACSASVTLNTAQARAYVSKAEEYLSAAVAELDAGRTIASTSLALHAGINASNAVVPDR